jgi:hypothetical protein
MSRGVGRPKALAEAVANITKSAFGKRGLSSAAIVNQWPDIIGPMLAAYSAPERIVYPKGKRTGGTLFLRIDSGSLAVELQHLQPLLMERINGYIGYRAVADIKILQGPLPPRIEAPPPRVRPLNAAEEHALATSLETVDDPGLRASLEALGRSVMGRREG